MRHLSIPHAFATSLDKSPTDNYLIGLKESVDPDKFLELKGFETRNPKKIKQINSLVVSLSPEELQTLQSEESIDYIEKDSPVKLAEVKLINK